MHQRIKISVAIVTYNQYENLKTTIDSVVNQTRAPDQIVVIDDGSDDQTINYLKNQQKSSPNFMWKVQVHSGVGKARSEAMNLVDGDIIAVVDSDDILFPGALASYEKLFMKYTNIDMVYGNVKLIDKNGNKLDENHYKNFKNNGKLKNAIFLAPKVPFKHSAIAFRKIAYNEIGGYDENCKIKVDIDLVLRFIKYNKKIIHINELLAGYRIHKNNLSRKRIYGLIQWYRLIFKYENNYLKRIYMFIVKTFWELSKLGVEIIRNLKVFKF